MSQTVDVLLATYNGARFLPELLASLEAQSHRDWRLILRDDGSTDETVTLVKEWARQTGRRFRVVEDGDKKVGPAENFARLLRRSDAPFFAFCDQDDVWLPDKLAQAVATIVSAEDEIGNDTPVLAHCDLKVVDQDLNPLNDSFWRHQGFRFTEVRAGKQDDAARKSLLIRNFVTGCAMAGNAALRQSAEPVPPDCVMHDWWLALIAAHTGEIRSIESPGILYRQHASNSLGAKGWSLIAVIRRTVLHDPGAAVQRTRVWLSSCRKQARDLAAKLSMSVSDNDLEYMVEFSKGRELGILSRKTYMFRHGVWPYSKVRSLIMFLFI